MADDPTNRREDRRDVNWISVIRLADGSELPCTVKDVSPSGLKICVAGSQEIPETFMLKVVGKALVFRVRKAWHRGFFLGVTIEKIAKLPDPPTVATEIERQEQVADYTRLGSRSRFGARS